MGRINDCINLQKPDGLSPENLEIWKETYIPHYEHLKQHMSEDAAEKMAANMAFERMLQENSRRRGLLLLEKQKRMDLMTRAVQSMENDKIHDKGKMAHFLVRLVENWDDGSSLAVRANQIVGAAQNKMVDFMRVANQKVNPKAVIGGNKVILKNVMREIFGVDTGDGNAAAFAKSWKDTVEYLRTRANVAGMNIGFREDWHLPQYHIKEKIMEGFDPKNVEGARKAWKDFYRPLLNLEKMNDSATGRAITPERLEEAMDKMFDRIMTRGQIDAKEGRILGYENLAETMKEARFFVFKDDEAWAKANERYGNGDMFGTMMGHIENMAKIISQLEILGPNPERQWSWLRAEATRQGLVGNLIDAKSEEKANATLKLAQNAMNQFTGVASQLHGSQVLKESFDGLSNLTHAAFLGSAAISDAASKPMMLQMGRAMMGFKNWWNFPAMFKTFNPLDPKDQEIAARAGFIMETATDSLARNVAMNRHNFFGELVRILPSITSRVSGLTQLSQWGKRLIGLESMGRFGDFAQLSLDEMAKIDGDEKGFAKTLKKWGFNSDEWDLIRQAPLWEPKEGVKFMHHREIEQYLLSLANADAPIITKAKAYELASKYGDMIVGQANFAAPETSLVGKALLQGETAEGTVRGSVLRSFSTYRTWSVTVFHYFGQELASIAAEKGIMAGAGAAAYFLAMMTLSGALQMQLKEIKKGNTPREDMDSPEFWQDAIWAGGGLSIIGDAFKMMSEQKYGGGTPVEMFGPQFAMATDYLNVGQDLVGLGWEAVTVEPPEHIMGHKTHWEKDGASKLGRDFSNLLAQDTPVLSSVWWMRAAWERAVVGSLRGLIDPHNEDKWEDYQKRLEDRGQEMWWSPGQVTPDLEELFDSETVQ